MQKIFEKFLFRIGSETVGVAKGIAPYKTGNLKKDIQVISVNDKSILIGNTTLAPYAKFVHYGTKPHIIKIKKAKALAWNSSGQTGSRGTKAFARKVNHPGTKAQPYLENALDRYLSSGGFTRAKTALASEVKSKVISDIKKAFKS
ncbi:TPA: HK97 gp10 family phage protein [Campylobacter fetus subsp. venerealis]|uniref:HK97 gp10 family phage protein n=1 Tax=Campylobacter fetus subsp. venerealis NCTC 10354 TaxID=983328 RepID=A0AAE6IXV9_CAMFE|nr:HK97 gp10 family phage protein [Campylobacter fetus]AIR80150.1 hypothetical protein CFV97608_0487 [Campylobacter fetus subsp. venerealis 97/608]MBK3487626.1 HK97 gp10 family phage protein [Campylobacter fetus subsp. venerealis]PHJ03300.1 hypothetical protein IW21_09215 [Campylobacter fetus subsp. venerealis]PHJ03691.1 hypothetical protein IW23_09270 [Campylobacter fetus subsp. venerealis]QEL44467.1 hypothetical protein CFVT_0487 [Campylobacter fetus subsp. venerealis NCTC 10354]